MDRDSTNMRNLISEKLRIWHWYLTLTSNLCLRTKDLKSKNLIYVPIIQAIHWYVISTKYRGGKLSYGFFISLRSNFDKTSLGYHEQLSELNLSIHLTVTEEMQSQGKQWPSNKLLNRKGFSSAWSFSKAPKLCIIIYITSKQHLAKKKVHARNKSGGRRRTKYSEQNQKV